MLPVTGGEIDDVAAADDEVVRQHFTKIGDDDLRMLPRSSNWLLAASEAEERIRDICTTCSFFGLCDGSPVAEATARELSVGRGSARCFVARTMYQEITRFLGFPPDFEKGSLQALGS